MGSDEAIDHVRRVPRPLLFTVLALAVILVGILGATLANAIPGVSAPQAHVAGVSPLSLTSQQSTPTASSATPSACICPSVKGNVPKPSGGVPKVAGQVILVSTTQQWLWAYDNGTLVLASPVTTGRPELPTPKGHYTVMNKQTNITFYSPWPVGSPFYYYPTHINYAMQFKSGGFYIHDAWWRNQFGPGSQFAHRAGDGTESGTHGCVNLPEDTTYVLFYWVHVGTPVIIV